ncbi:hypothetical protein RsS62_38390 [Rhizobium dioscoreae]|nr:hypothetical protein RsS62_38390 [Rhizobium dioscoreae]
MPSAATTEPSATPAKAVAITIAFHFISFSYLSGVQDRACGPAHDYGDMFAGFLSGNEVTKW